jgi:hypothetical protein
MTAHGTNNEQAAVEQSFFIERRRAVRAGERVRVLLREDRFATSGYTLNVSRHGALIRSAAPLRLGADYDFYLQGDGCCGSCLTTGTRCGSRTRSRNSARSAPVRPRPGALLISVWGCGVWERGSAPRPTARLPQCRHCPRHADCGTPRTRRSVLLAGPARCRIVGQRRVSLPFRQTSAAFGGPPFQKQDID